MIDPFWAALAADRSKEPASSLLGEDAFRELYAAAEFAAVFGIALNTMVTLSWNHMGLTTDEDVKRAFESFQKCVRDWAAQRRMPLAFIYVHERSPSIGLHTHLVLHFPTSPLPGPTRDFAEFRDWTYDWVERRRKRSVPHSVRVTGGSKPSVLRPWILFSYLLKGYDPRAVVRSERNSPDKRPVYLGDLIAARWRDPGHVGLKRYGVSHSLGPGSRKEGVPSCVAHRYKGNAQMAPVPFGAPPEPGDTFICILEGDVPIRMRRTTYHSEFRSRYDDGIRHVGLLYPEEFYRKITGLSSPRELAEMAAQIAAQDRYHANRWHTRPEAYEMF